MDEQWSEWREHDGKGCPVKGQWVETVAADGFRAVHIADCGTRLDSGIVARVNTGIRNAWLWRSIPAAVFDRRIVRYRVRRPRGMSVIDAILRDVKEPQDA